MKRIVRNEKIFIGINLLFNILVPIFCLILAIFTISANVFNVKNILNSQEVAQTSNKEKVVISSFSTDYSKSPDNRKFNIRLALKSLNNQVVKAGEEFSFNKVVGERTEERGYKKALVIFKGSYTEGVGGGVCQVSSTLYNAWLLAGLDVVSVRAHTLPASYVEVSRDATVSEVIDLKLKNSLQTDVIIKTEYDDKSIMIKIEGEEREYNYSLKSEILEVVPFGEDIVEVDEEGEDEYYIGKDGYVSRLIITISKGDNVIARRVLRKDHYKPQNSVRIIRKPQLNQIT